MTSNDFVITVTSKDRRKSFPIPQDKHTKIYQIIQNIIGIIMYVQNRTGIFFLYVPKLYRYGFVYGIQNYHTGTILLYKIIPAWQLGRPKSRQWGWLKIRCRNLKIYVRREEPDILGATFLGKVQNLRPGGRRFVLFGVENKTCPPAGGAKNPAPPCRRPKILPAPLHDFTIEK